MKFKTHNDKPINIGGTHLQGEIIVSYAELVKIFGKPDKGDDYKIDAEWNLEFEDGTIATIYNYKNGKNYCGRSGMAKSKITEWHIGGFTKNAMEKVYYVIYVAREKAKRGQKC